MNNFTSRTGMATPVAKPRRQTSVSLNTTLRRQTTSSTFQADGEDICTKPTKDSMGLRLHLPITDQFSASSSRQHVNKAKTELRIPGTTSLMATKLSNSASSSKRMIASPFSSSSSMTHLNAHARKSPSQTVRQQLTKEPKQRHLRSSSNSKPAGIPQIANRVNARTRNATTQPSKVSRPRGSIGQRKPLLQGNQPRQHRKSVDSTSGSERKGPSERLNSEEEQLSGVQIRPIAYNSVKEMVQDETLNVGHIALRLTTEYSGFELRLKLNMDDGWIKLILHLMKKLCSANMPSRHLNLVLIALLNNDFELKVMRLLKGVFGRSPLRNAEDAAVHISNCLHLVRGWLVYTQNTAEQAITVLLPYIKTIVAHHTLETYENIRNRLLEIDNLRQNRYMQPQPSTKRNHDRDQEHEDEPPDNFREISVFPTNDEIKATESPFVRTNLIDSAYRNTDHYLDVQFRLLREDFIRPLREGINDFVNPDTSGINLGKKRRRKQGLKMYDDVIIEFPKLNNRGIHYCIRFDTSRLKFVQWQNSKRLLYGNLVCISPDDFEDHFLFATVTNRDVEKLKMGYIEVEFLSVGNITISEPGTQREATAASRQEVIEGKCLVSLADMKKTYRMVESEAYFEAYRHVLAGLKETRKIPLEQYIVHCQTNINAPAYLLKFGKQPTYNFSFILNKQEGNSYNKVYPVLDTEKWPAAKELNLDPSQVQALKSALTNELSIIQGPPGTGKTHVGLTIMKMLLGNKTREKMAHDARFRIREPTKATARVPAGPIFVVCFTNHALDQFLEGIAKFHPHGLIRVGGRCKAESLQKYMLSEVRRNSRPEHSKTMKKTLWEIRRDLDEKVAKWQKLEKTLRESTDGIVFFETLQRVISEAHLNQLRQLKDVGGGDDVILSWLGVEVRQYSLPEDFYIVEETVNAMSTSATLRGFTRNDFIVAANATGTLEEEAVLRWLCSNPVSQQQATIQSDIVFKFLDELRISFDLNRLLEKGFHQLEVKCAWIVCFIKYGEDKANEIAVSSWLGKKRGEEDNLLDTRAEQRGRKLQTMTTEREIPTARLENLQPVSGDGFEVQRSERKRLNREMKLNLSKMVAMTEKEAFAVNSISNLKWEEKWKLYQYWVNKLRSSIGQSLNGHAAEINRLAKALAEIRSQEDMDVLQKADVVAMTTSGAAKYRDMVYKLSVKIMVVEEAAEVLEAHIITSMPKSTEHLILIGDHQQLKPSPTVYELVRKFNLDTSLFERMVKNGIPCSRLTLQHRMRPRIADLIRPHIYKELNDHDSVKTYWNVSGVEKNVFFMSHTHEEDNVRDTMSKANQYEAEVVVSFCKYLLQQGYLPDQITILTAYVGQLFAFKNIMARKLSDKRVRVTAVDNFQGEENDIILLSLVRSNAEDNIGFLSIENRVCVALSRAKKGLYCIGNFEMLKRKNELWRKILTTLSDNDMVGNALPLQCKNHPEKKLKVKTESDFKQFPEGGCGVKCFYRLDCGHSCKRLCHPDDEEHETNVCTEPCKKYCPAPEAHELNTICCEQPICKTKVNKIMPGCRHIQELFCHQDPKDMTCQTRCKKILSCGHDCPSVCGMKCPSHCEVPVKIERACVHLGEVPCSDAKKVSAANWRVKCNEILKCGHPCKGTCGQCMQGRLHVGCSNSRCGTVLSCGHKCKEKCSEVCPPCMEKCNSHCPHSICSEVCFKPCRLCKEKCVWKCQHYKCSKLCSEPCDRPRCDEPCPKKLECNHPCIGLCGEPCPDLCEICDDKEFAKIKIPKKYEKNSRFVQLECKHIFHYKHLDKWMEETLPKGCQSICIKLKECPECKIPIRHCTRYGSFINQQLLLINKVKLRIAGNLDEIKRSGNKLLEFLKADKLTATHFVAQARQLLHQLKTAHSLCALKVLEEQYDCLEEFASYKELMQKLGKSSDSCLNKTVDQIVDWLFWKRSFFSEQEKEDLHLERKRCKDGLKLTQLQDKVETLTEENKSHLKEMQKHVVDDLSPYLESKQEKFEALLSKIEIFLPHIIQNLGVKHEIRSSVLGSIKLSKGQWYMCKNKHIYCNGNHGDPAVQIRCSVCEETADKPSLVPAEEECIVGVKDQQIASAAVPNSTKINEDILIWRDGD